MAPCSLLVAQPGTMLDDPSGRHGIERAIFSRREEGVLVISYAFCSKRQKTLRYIWREVVGGVVVWGTHSHL